KIDENRRTVRGNNFQKKYITRFQQTLPGTADSAGEFLGIHSGRNPGYQPRRLKFYNSLNHRIEWVNSRDDQEVDGLALLFGNGDHTTEQFPFVIREQLILRQFIFAGAGRHTADGHHNDVVASKVGFLQHTLQVGHPAVIANRHENGTRARMNRSLGRVDLRPYIKVEFLELMLTI